MIEKLWKNEKGRITNAGYHMTNVTPLVVWNVSGNELKDIRAAGTNYISHSLYI